MIEFGLEFRININFSLRFQRKTFRFDHVGAHRLMRSDHILGRREFMGIVQAIPSGIIDGSCFNTYFDIANQALCAAFVTFRRASFRQ